MPSAVPAVSLSALSSFLWCRRYEAATEGKRFYCLMPFTSLRLLETSPLITGTDAASLFSCYFGYGEGGFQLPARPNPGAPLPPPAPLQSFPTSVACPEGGKAPDPAEFPFLSPPAPHSAPPAPERRGVRGRLCPPLLFEHLKKKKEIIQLF